MSDLGRMAVRFDDEADAELLDAGQYYAERSPKAAADFASAMEAALEQIQQMPWSAPAWPGRPDLRRRVLARYPYAIVYMVVDPTEIVVVAVEHAKRRPGTGLAEFGDSVAAGVWPAVRRLAIFAAVADDDGARFDQLVQELASNPGYASGVAKFPRRVSLDEAAQIAARLQHEVDRGVEQREAMIAARGWQLACKRGCNNCCEEPIMIFRPEAARVARWLDRPENAEVRAAFRAAYPAWRDRQGDTPARLSATFVNKPAQYVAAHKEAWAKRILCAFNVDGACSIYPVRPTVCRLAHALDTSEHCHGGATQPVHRTTFVPLDQFVLRTHKLLAAAHNAARGPKARAEALCTAVYELLPPTPRPA